MQKSHNIILVGPMGAGKTTLGKALAQELGKNFYDADEQIETAAGASVSWIFEIEGEAGFREREEKMLHELTKKQDIVLATGGGAILRETNRERIKQTGFVIYLQVSVAEQLIRLEKSLTRPLLLTGDREEKLTAIIQQREAHYLSVADLVLPTDKRSIQVLVQQICEMVQGK